MRRPRAHAPWRAKYLRPGSRRKPMDVVPIKIALRAEHKRAYLVVAADRAARNNSVGRKSRSTQGLRNNRLGPRPVASDDLAQCLARSFACHYATAAAFTTAQAFHVGSDWRVRVEAETNKSGVGQTSFMPTMQATHDHYPTSLTQRGHHPYMGPRACGIEWPAIIGTARR
jgi:hypothetical protein